MSSSSPVQDSLRRLRPEKHISPLRLRDRTSLTYFDPLQHSFLKLLVDTTVYIDELQGRLPKDVEVVLRGPALWHSTVTEAELSALLGLLNPAHRDTPSVSRQIVELLERRPARRMVTPDQEVWREAGILSGELARLQGYGKSERTRALNDALIFLSAAKHGCTVLTRNVGDFDLLMQLAPFGRVIFYEVQ